MKTFKAVDKNGKSYFVAAYSESEALQLAETQLGDGNIAQFFEA